MKIIKKHIKTAIIIYDDPDLKKGRRVIFGKPINIFHLLIREMPIVLDRVKQISGKNFNNPMEMIAYFMSHKEEWVKLHGTEASGDMEIDLTYEAKNLESPKRG